jgi:hypothetical protein
LLEEPCQPLQRLFRAPGGQRRQRAGRSGGRAAGAKLAAPEVAVFAALDAEETLLAARALGDGQVPGQPPGRLRRSAPAPPVGELAMAAGLLAAHRQRWPWGAAVTEPSPRGWPSSSRCPSGASFQHCSSASSRITQLTQRSKSGTTRAAQSRTAALGRSSRQCANSSRRRCRYAAYGPVTTWCEYVKQCRRADGREADPGRDGPTPRDPRPVRTAPIAAPPRRWCGPAEPKVTLPAPEEAA